MKTGPVFGNLLQRLTTRLSIAWPVLASVFSIALVSVMGSAPAAGQRTEEFAVESGGKLTVNCEAGGSLQVEGWDRALARVIVWDDCNDLSDYDLEFHPVELGLEINAELKGRRNSTCLQFEIKVPRKFDVEFQSAGGGLDLKNLEGTFTGRTGGGGLDLQDCKGRARLRSGGGSINVANCELDGYVKTGGGEALLENVVGDLEAHSGGGEVRYMNVRDRDGNIRGPGDCPERAVSRETVLISSAGGSIDVREAPAGACVQTGGGEVSVRKASRFVVARTGGGDIEVEIEAGAVTAATGAGDIDVAIEREDREPAADVDLRTGYGDVELIVPKGYSMDLDLTIGYTRNSRRDYRIECAGPFDEERSSEWEHEYGLGSAKKYIYGKGSINGGRHAIKVRTTNGNIRIRER